MKKSPVVVLVFLIYGLFSLTASAQEQRLMLEAGTIQIGGEVAVSVDRYLPEYGEGIGGVLLSFSPTIGYFIIDNLEMLGKVSLTMGTGDLYDERTRTFSFGAGVRYLFDLSIAVHPYMGGLVGMNMSFLQTENETLKSMKFSIPVGIMIGLNEHVGLDLGMAFHYYIGLDNQGDTMRIPIGYFGLEAFF